MAIISHLQSNEFENILDTFPDVLRKYINLLIEPTSEIAKSFSLLSCGEKYERNLGHGLKAIEQCYLSTTRDKAIIESHKNFIDFQLIFEGEELMETAYSSLLKIKTEYSKDKDLIVYEESSDLHLLKMTRYCFAIFKPEDAHRSTLQLTKPSLVRKVVIKVPI